MVRRAYENRKNRRHHDQFRSSGDPSLPSSFGRAHPAEHAPRPTALTAAIPTTPSKITEYPRLAIEERFGAEVAHLVEGGNKKSAASK